MTHSGDRQGLTGTIRSVWDRFWFPRGSAIGLAIFRILFAICLLWEVEITRAKSVFAIEGGFHLPYVSFIQPVSQALYDAMHDWQYPLIVLIGIGLLTRPALALLIGLQGYIFFADHFNFRNHPYFFLIVLLLLIFSPCDEMLSVRAWLRGIMRRKQGTSTPTTLPLLTSQQLIKLQISIVYFFAALHKISEPYLNGTVMAELMSRDVMRGYSGAMLAALFSRDTLQWIDAFVKEPSTWVIVSWVTVILELLLPFALWFRKTRRVAILFGIPFHLGIAWLMTIYTFSLAMIGSYILFLDPDALAARWERFKSRGTRPKPARTRHRKKALARR